MNGLVTDRKVSETAAVARIVLGAVAGALAGAAGGFLVVPSPVMALFGALGGAVAGLVGAARAAEAAGQ